MRALRVTSLPWPNPDACDELPSVPARHGFTTVSCERRTSWFALDTAAAATLLLDSLYLPDVRPERIAAAKYRLKSHPRPGRCIPPPLKRIVAYANESTRAVTPYKRPNAS